MASGWRRVGGAQAFLSAAPTRSLHDVPVLSGAAQRSSCSIGVVLISPVLSGVTARGMLPMMSGAPARSVLLILVPSGDPIRGALTILSGASSQGVFVVQF